MTVKLVKERVPIVEMNVGEKMSSVKRTKMDVFPTAESPINKSLKR